MFSVASRTEVPTSLSVSIIHTSVRSSPTFRIALESIAIRRADCPSASVVGDVPSIDLKAPIQYQNQPSQATSVNGPGIAVGPISDAFVVTMHIPTATRVKPSSAPPVALKPMSRSPRVLTIV